MSVIRVRTSALYLCKWAGRHVTHVPDLDRLPRDILSAYPIFALIQGPTENNFDTVILVNSLPTQIQRANVKGGAHRKHSFYERMYYKSKCQ